MWNQLREEALMFDYREFPFKSFLDTNLKLGPLLLLAVVGGSTAALGAGGAVPTPPAANPFGGAPRRF